MKRQAKKPPTARSAALFGAVALLLLGNPTAAAAGRRKPPRKSADTRKAAADAKAEQESEDAADAAEYRVRVDRWYYARERKTITGSNRVHLAVHLTNRAKKRLSGVQVNIEPLSELGQPLGLSFRKIVGPLAPGASVPVRFTREWVPVFGAYRVNVRYRVPGEKEEVRETWRGTTPAAQPRPAPTKLMPGRAFVTIIGQDGNFDRRQRLRGQVRVRNLGDQEATALKLTVLFLAPARGKNKRAGNTGKVLYSWTGKLGDGKLAGGAEQTFRFLVPKPAPRGYAGRRLKVSCAEMSGLAALGGGKFKNTKDVECAYFVFKRDDKKKDALAVACKVRNGLSRPVSDLKITLRFYKQSGGKRKTVRKLVCPVEGNLAPGAVRALNFKPAKVPAFDSFEHELAFSEASAAPAGGKKTTAAPVKKPRFSGKPVVEVLLEEFVTRKDGTVLVAAKIRNGRARVVKDVTISVRFRRADGSVLTSVVKKIKTPLVPGEVRGFVLHAKDAKGFASYDSDVRYVEIKKVHVKKPAGKSSPPAPAEAPAEAAPPAPKETDKQQ